MVFNSRIKSSIDVMQQGGLLSCNNFFLDDSHLHLEFLTAINQAVTEKVTVILASAKFFAILSVGSQARKTGNDKELVMIHLERNDNL